MLDLFFHNFLIVLLTISRKIYPQITKTVVFIFLWYTFLMNGYKKRIADEILQKKLSIMGAVLIEGPKWCGKTTTGEQNSKSSIYLDNPITQERNKILIETSPDKILNGDNPRLLDEWQLFPSLWDIIRYDIDHKNSSGLYILTGSSTPPDTSSINHTGTGRISRLRMRTMSLYESRESNGSVSLSSLFSDSSDVSGSSQLTLDDIAYLICRGGWPKATLINSDLSLEYAKEYFDSVINFGYPFDFNQKNKDRVISFMRSFSRNIGGQTALSVIARDINTYDEVIAKYITSLSNSFVIEELNAWNPKIRRKSAIRTSPTHYFSDPSIAVSSLGLGPGDLFSDLNTFGYLFEAMCIRDLRVYAESLGGNVYHYRDSDGDECDAVIHLRNGSYGLVEIKLGGETLINSGIKSLKKLKNKLDTTKMKDPSFLMVLTANDTEAYIRDGVVVAPIGALKP